MVVIFKEIKFPPGTVTAWELGGWENFAPQTAEYLYPDNCCSRGGLQSVGEARNVPATFVCPTDVSRADLNSLRVLWLGELEVRGLILSASHHEFVFPD